MRMQQQQPSESNDNTMQRHTPKRRKSFGQRFVESYVPNKNDTKSDLIRKIVLIAAVFVLIGSAVYISSYFGESKSNKDKNASLQSIWEQMGAAGDAEDIEVDDDYPKDYLKKFFPLYQQNPDIRGWITIDGTQVNYPVMQTDNNKDYDRTDFEKKSNQHGVPFADYRVDLKKPSTNTVIYGHNMTDGQMFGELIKYKSLEYYKANPLIKFDSVYAEGQYKVAAIIVCRADDEDFLYHNFINADKNAANMNMEQYIAKVRERSLINTTVDIKPTDKLITLSTCDYSFKDPVTNERIARFVVVGRKVRAGESATVDTAAAKLNPNPVMPSEWTAFIKKQQETELKAQVASEASKQYGPIREEAKKWFTAAELAQIKDENLEVETARRKETMSQYLDANELASLSADQKVALLKERQSSVDLEEEARNAILDNEDLYWMSDSEINAFAKELVKAGKSQWASLMKKRAAASEVEVSLDATSFTITKGDSRMLEVYTSGGSGTPKWTSDKASVAEVRNDGTVVAKKAGTATITVTYGGRNATCKVTVTNEDVVETVISMPSTANLAVGGTLILAPVVSPDKMAETGVKWSVTSGKSYIEVVDSTTTEMVIKGVTEGKTAKVTATAKDGTTATCTITIKAEVIPVTINPSSVTLEPGKSTTLLLSDDKAKAKWTIKGSAAAISASDVTSCTIDALAEGSATVTATLTDGQVITCTVTVKAAAETVTINPATLSLEVGKSGSLSLSSPNAKAKSWKSSDENVAAASGDELGCTVTAGKEGTATITVTLSDNKTATCKVTVKAGAVEAPPVTIDPASLSLTVGKSSTLFITGNDKVTAKGWKSSKADVADIIDNGDGSCTVDAYAEGKTTITVTLSDGKTATCTVTVKAEAAPPDKNSSTPADDSSSTPPEPPTPNQPEPPKESAAPPPPAAPAA